MLDLHNPEMSRLLSEAMEYIKHESLTLTIHEYKLDPTSERKIYLAYIQKRLNNKLYESRVSSTIQSGAIVEAYLQWINFCRDFYFIRM